MHPVLGEVELAEKTKQYPTTRARCGRCIKWKDVSCFRVSPDPGFEGKPFRYCLDCEARDARGDGKSTMERFGEKRERILTSDIAREVEAEGDDFEAIEKVAAARKGVALAALFERVLAGDASAIKLWFEIGGRPKPGQAGDEEWTKLQRNGGG
jgi:hypothetical protein